METATASANFRKLFHPISFTDAKRRGVSETICETDGTPPAFFVDNQKDRLDINKQFNWPSAPAKIIPAERGNYWSVYLDPPNEAEICNLLALLKHHKAPGPDDLQPGYDIGKQLMYVFFKTTDEEEISPNWTESMVMLVFKKGSQTVGCHRTRISLIQLASKVLASVASCRLTTQGGKIHERQGEFRPGRGCTDQIFTVHQPLEHRHTYQRPTSSMFLDRKTLIQWKRLLCGSACWDTAYLKSMYQSSSPSSLILKSRCPSQASDSLCCFQHGLTRASYFVISHCDGWYFQKISWELSRWWSRTLISGHKLRDLKYAVDIVLLSSNVQTTQLLPNSLMTKWSDTACSPHYQSVRFYLRISESMYPNCTRAVKDWKLLKVFFYSESCIYGNRGVGENI